MDEAVISRASSALVCAVRTIFEDYAAKDALKTAQLNHAIRLMEELRPDPDRTDLNRLPVCQYLARALDLGANGPAASVASAIRDLEPVITWAQNPRYTLENRGAEFLENYGWSGLGLTGSSEMSFGILLLGPNTTYPLTSYESEGIFLVIGGKPYWKSGNLPWTQVADGDVICRHWNGAEGKRTGQEPMLALYAWMYRPTGSATPR